ncbi:MAG: hypothetical protein DYH12_03685 [Sorangiineae bacterium PRO1]|nr:hypothetical protein [Sorangiineae bacterium PRO1]
MAGLFDVAGLDPAEAGAKGMRRVLFVVGFGFCFVWLQLYFTLVLSADERDSLSRLLGVLGSTGATTGVVTVLALVFSLLGVSYWRVHEAVYDAWFLKWRRRHDARFVLPRLFEPYAAHLRLNYRQSLEKHWRSLSIAVFCPFVDGGEYQVEPRLVNRFYRALTLHWAAILFEFALALWLVSVLGHYYWGSHVPSELARLWTLSWAAAALLLVNAQVFRRLSKRLVERRCEEEIVDIKTRFPDRLQVLVTAAAKKHDFLHPHRGDLSEPAEAPVPATAEGVPGLWDHAYLASPIAAHTNEEYVADRTLMLKVSEMLLESGFRKVHYPGADVKDHAAIEDAYVALLKDLRSIRESGTFVLHWPSRVASSALFELGYALALQKRVILLVRSRADLPFLLSPLSQLKNVHEAGYTDEPTLLRTVSDLCALLFAEDRAASLAVNEAAPSQ